MNEPQPTIDKLTPVGFRVLLSIYKKPATTTWGASLPEHENSGIPVIAQIVGLGKKTFWQRIFSLLGFRIRYSIGQWIYFRKYSVDELKVNSPDGEVKIFVLDEDEIIGVVN